MVGPTKQSDTRVAASPAEVSLHDAHLPRRGSIELSLGSRYGSVAEAIEGLSRTPGQIVNELVVTRMFATDKFGEVALPPIPRRDPELCKHVASMVERINQPLRDLEKTKEFLGKMFSGPAGRVLNSYEIELLEFAVNHKDTVSIMYEPLTRHHAQESSKSGEERVVFGRKHHHEPRDYTPEEAFSTFLHEVAHAREAVYALLERRGPPQVILSEVHANAYGNGGRIGAAISLTSQLYKPVFNELKSWMPGFDSLAPLDRYKYLSIMATDHSAPTAALIYEADRLVSAFPQLEESIHSAVQHAIRHQDALADE